MAKRIQRPTPLPVDDTPPANFVAPKAVTVTVTRVGGCDGPEFAVFDVLYAPKEDESASPLRKAVSSLVRRNVLAAYVCSEDLCDESFAGGGEHEVDPCALEIIKQVDCEDDDDDDEEEEEEEADEEPQAKRARKVPTAVARPVLESVGGYKKASKLFREGTRCVTTEASERAISIVYQLIL